MVKPTIICLTPVKNEAWILDRFLQCASLWADHIIIADQSSTDNSVEIARRYSKITLIHNHSIGLNEPERQKLLLEAARRISGPRLLITLDADEVFTANFMNSPEWQTMLTVPAGTVIRFNWVNLKSDMEHYWDHPWDHAWGFMDDDSELTGSDVIHNTRIPVPLKSSDILMREIKVMHYQYTDERRRESKWRWYRCFERMLYKERSAIQINRYYCERYDTLDPSQLRPIPSSWLQGYRDQGINMTSICRTYRPWWDKEVVDMLEKYGTERFRYLKIWDVDWTAIYREIYGKEPSQSLRDPRNQFDKWVHRWLQASQAYYRPYNKTLDIRIIEKILTLIGW